MEYKVINIEFWCGGCDYQSDIDIDSGLTIQNLIEQIKEKHNTHSKECLGIDISFRY